MQKVIFDSSFLMSVAETPTTWFDDIVDNVGKFQPILPDCVRDELERLAAGQNDKGRFARLCLNLASKFSTIRCGHAKVDDEIMSAALTNGALVATTDAALTRSLRAVHVRVISLRTGRVSLS